MNKGKIQLEKPAAAHLYLGCIHKRETVRLPNGASARAVVYDMESYLRSTVARYQSLVHKLEGKTPTLKKVETPFLPEDQRLAPARAPCSKGKCHTCPWCSHTFSAEDEKLFQEALSTLRKAQKSAKGAGTSPGTAPDGGSSAQSTEATGSGRLQAIAASILMGLLYAARMARFDLLRATCKLACFTTKWRQTVISVSID